MQTLKKLFWYAGVEPEEYQQCQQEVAEDNRKKLQLYLMIAAGFLFFCFCVSGGVKVLRPYSMCYGVGFLVIAGLEAVNLMFPEHNGLLLTWLMYALAGALYGHGHGDVLHNAPMALGGVRGLPAGDAAAVHDGTHPAHCEHRFLWWDLHCICLSV